MTTITAQLSEHPVPAHMVEAAARIVADEQVTPVGTHAYRVRDYVVTIHDGQVECTCPSRIRCKHMLAALLVHTES